MLSNIKNKYILKKIVHYVLEKRNLNLVKYNKKLQNRMDISIDDYKKYDRIEIEIIPVEELSDINENNKFINFMNKKQFYHIYFNESKKEIKRNFIKKGENVEKIIIKIDIKVSSLKKLFYECEATKEIKFKIFNTKNITDMSFMFSSCSNLVKLDILKLLTDNTTSMYNMFSNCIKIKELDLSSFNTENVEDMDSMFYGCESLEKLDISKFMTYEDSHMISMFEKCKSLKYLDLSQFYIPYDSRNIKHMFKGCSELLKLKIKNQKNLCEIAFL